MSTELKWAMFPSGRWATSIESHGGTLFIHASVSGSWAITRGQVGLTRTYTILLRGADDGQVQGADLQEAMRMGEDAARAIAERERDEHMGTGDVIQGKLFVRF